MFFFIVLTCLEVFEEIDYLRLKTQKLNTGKITFFYGNCIEQNQKLHSNFDNLVSDCIAYHWDNTGTRISYKISEFLLS